MLCPCFTKLSLGVPKWVYSGRLFFVSQEQIKGIIIIEAQYDIIERPRDVVVSHLGAEQETVCYGNAMHEDDAPGSHNASFVILSHPRTFCDVLVRDTDQRKVATLCVAYTHLSINLYRHVEISFFAFLHPSVRGVTS
jgi:hypothetical protein